MKEFIVKIVTPDGELFNGEAKSILVKTTDGDVQILRAHADFLAPLGVGKAKLTLSDGTERTASSSGGFILVSEGEAKVVATTFEFSDTIDIERAKRAKEKAEKLLSSAKTETEIDIAKAKLARALSRISVKESSK